MTPLRIVYLTHVAQLSGAELGLLRFLRAAHGVEATVILAEDGPLAGALREAGAQVEVLELAGRARNLRRAQVGAGTAAQARAAADVGRYVTRLAARLRTLRPDLVHTNSLKAGVYGSLAARAARLPVVWHLHDRLAADYLPARAVTPMRALAGTLPTALVAPSQTTLATVTRRRHGLRTAVIPFPIDPPAAAPSRNGAGVRRVGIVGRITRWKGQHVFLDAVARAFPDGGVEAVVVGAPMFGTEEEAYARSLQAQARDLGVRADFRGFRDDVAAELGRLDVLVHASILDEPYGQVILEGMAAGVPVVATQGSGAAEVLEDGTHGLLYPRGDVDALAAALGTLAADAGLRARLAAAGRAKAAEFGPDAVVDRMLTLYRDLA